MKKTLAALAVLGAFAGTTAAADVTLYGDVDYGFAYTHTDIQNYKSANDVDAKDNFEMVNGINSASKFGLKGVEDLGNGVKVGFKLENGFEADDGTLSMENRLFGREATLSVYSDFGTVSFGRMGALGAATGSYDVVYGIGDAFDGGDEYALGFAQTGRLDNALVYQTPEFAGLQATLQYSFKVDNSVAVENGIDAVEGESTAERYFGAAVTGTYGPAQFVAAYELTKYSTAYRADNYQRDDAQIVYAGANYDFGVAKVFAMGQYFTGLNKFAGLSELESTAFDGAFKSEKGWEGYSLHAGTIVPVADGELTVGVYYSDAEAKDFQTINGLTVDNYKGDYIGVAARYAYPLSKRTTVYVGGSYSEATVDMPTYTTAADGVSQAAAGIDQDGKEKIAAAYVGIAHHF